jgi:hypothetical protein
MEKKETQKLTSKLDKRQNIIGSQLLRWFPSNDV